ncbi:hypothetical protein HYV85_03040 [Candidatus Woesearchaeota archaeon]|nr:hypothetical protein [Candidatus Woesearchaeota archaeon]
MAKVLPGKIASRKKGQAPSQTSLIIFSVAVIIALAVFFKFAVKVVHAQDLVQGCHLSTKLASWELKKDLFVMDWTILDSPFSLNCETLFTEVHKDSFVRAGYNGKLSEDPAERVEQLKELVVAQMAECWYMYGEGKAKIQQAVDSDNDKTTCIVCSEIIPDKEAIEEKISLPGMYGYAASTNAPPPNSDKSYLDYFLEGADKSKITISLFDHGITLNRPYSVVFAVTDQTDYKYALFGRKETIKPGTGIVDCYLGGYSENPVKDKNKDDKSAEAIGCKPDGTNPAGLIFGKVIDGGKHDELLTWRNAPIVSLVTGGSAGLKRFPMTVRLVPTGELKNYCNRLY